MKSVIFAIVVMSSIVYGKLNNRNGLFGKEEIQKASQTHWFP
jgi:hypothetical protein